jgi:hypothetical protein
MTRFHNVGGMLYPPEDADATFERTEETICQSCRDSVRYTWYWYDDEEMDDIQKQVNDGERSFKDVGMSGPISKGTQRRRFNALHAHYTAVAAGAFTLRVTLSLSVYCEFCARLCAV